MWYIYDELLSNPEKEGNSAVCHNMDGTWRHPKWGKSDRERKYCVVTFIGGISKKTELVKTEKW